MNHSERGKKIAEAKRSQPDRYQGGRVPFGYRKTAEGMLEKDPKTYPVLQGIIQSAGQKLRSRDIQKGLLDRGISISHMTIYRIIKKAQFSKKKSYRERLATVPLPVGRVGAEPDWGRGGTAMRMADTPEWRNHWRVLPYAG